MVCGSIGYDGFNKIRRIYAILHQKGFDIVHRLGAPPGCRDNNIPISVFGNKPVNEYPQFTLGPL